MYRRKWTPNAAQKAAYAASCREAEAIAEEAGGYIQSGYPIRVGCFVKYMSVGRDAYVVEGKVITSSYGSQTGQHTFTIDWDGDKVLVKGRNLYNRLLEHIPGDIARKDNKYA